MQRLHFIPNITIKALLTKNIDLITRTSNLKKVYLKKRLSSNKSVPVGVLKILYPDKKLSESLYNFKIHSKGGKEGACVAPINPEIAYLIGIVCTDGHIERNGRRVKIVQKNDDYLREMLKLVENNFDITGRNWLRIDHKYTSRLEINSAPISYIFSEVYGIPIGGKRLFSVPQSIRENSFDNQMAFLAGAFDGDGGIYNYESFKDFKRPMIAICSISESFLSGISNILSKHSIKNDTLALRKGAIMLIRVRRLDDVLKLSYYMWPHIRLERKRTKARNFLTQRRSLSILRVENTEQFRHLLKTIKKGIQNEHLLKLINENLIWKVGMPTVSDWLINRARPSLGSVLSLCTYAGEPLQKYILPHHQFLVKLFNEQTGLTQQTKVVQP